MGWRVSECTREIGVGMACFRVHEGIRGWDGVFQSGRGNKKLGWHVSECTKEVGVEIACFRVHEGIRGWDGVFQSGRGK